eukprot:1450650-Rhodomonas_salina.2
MGIKWQDAQQQRSLAVRQAEIAEFQTREAKRHSALAEERRLVASTQLFLFHAKTDTNYDGYAQAPSPVLRCAVGWCGGC